ncbi:MAG: DUF4278 domain-containing protein [Xenococcaceae cyanobacterium MO_188.B19]|nr:DUF4278 domain-containing protein [Xenococcaceae cyanobacterium MO_188.B19]
MKLKYRGVFYDYNPTQVPLLEGKVKGKYRGVPWQETIPQITKTAEPSIDLKYRGVPYRKGTVKLTNIEAKPAKTSLTSLHR